MVKATSARPPPPTATRSVVSAAGSTTSVPSSAATRQGAPVTDTSWLNESVLTTRSRTGVPGATRCCAIVSAVPRAARSPRSLSQVWNSTASSTPTGAAPRGSTTSAPNRPRTTCSEDAWWAWYQ
jgi:hypothetical protein